MVTSDSFREFLSEQLAELGHVTMRRMFGKTGVFCDGVMFGMVTDDTLYFRTDPRNTPDFEAAGMSPFTYRRDGREVALGYWTVPAEILDEGDRLAQWAEKAYAAALGKAAGRGRRKR